MPLTRIILVALVALVVSGPALAAEPHYCQRLITTGHVEDLVPGCENGDTLILQIKGQVAPGPIIGQLCNLQYEVWTETIKHQTTAVCSYLKKERRTTGTENQ